MPPGEPGRRTAAGMGVFTTDSDLTVRTWDDWLAASTGIAPEAARGRPLRELIPDLERRELVSPFQHVLARGVVEILAPAFHRYLVACPPVSPSPRFDRMQQRVTIGPLRENGQIVGTIVAIEDVTERLDRERTLAEQLASLEPDLRLRAADLLARSDPLGEADPLLLAMGDEDWQVRRTAVGGLARRRTADVIEAVLRALREDHRNFSVLSSAIELLAASDVDVLEPLVALLRSPDADLRMQAALVLGERGDSRATPFLMSALDDPDENVRFHAIEAVGKLKASAAVERLAAIAQADGFFLAFPALEALSRIGDPSVAPLLVPFLKDELLRGAAAEVLGRLGADDVVVPLTGLLNESTAPTEVVAGALASVYDRFETRYGEGEHIAQLVRGAISPTGTQNLLDAIASASGDHLVAITTLLGWLEGLAVDRTLTRLLGQPAVRPTVVEYLVRHGGRVVQLLVEQLEAEDLETRHAAVVGLGRIGDRRATNPLVSVLTGDRELTVAAAGALARIGDRSACDALFGLIGDPDPAVRQAVIAALNSIGHPDMAGRVAPLLRTADPEVRESAVRIAGYFGYSECADDLVAAASDAYPMVRRAALEHLPYLDDARVPEVLLTALHDPDPKMRAAAAQGLSRIDDARAGTALVGALQDGDAWVRYFAARGLGRQQHEAAVDALTRAALDDAAGQVRLAAVDALGATGSATAVPPLAALSASDDAERAIAAIGALGTIASPASWDPLRTALRHGDAERRAAAAAAIARLGGTAAVEELEWAAGADSSPAVVAAAMAALGRLAVEDTALGRRVVAALIRLAGDPAPRDQVVDVLTRVPPALIPEMELGLRDPRPGVRVAIVRALGPMRRAEASQLLQSALGDPVAEVRLAALTELRHLGTRGIERRLVTLAHRDPDGAVRRAALAVLRATGGDVPPADDPVDGPGQDA